MTQLTALVRLLILSVLVTIVCLIAALVAGCAEPVSAPEPATTTSSTTTSSTTTSSSTTSSSTTSSSTTSSTTTTLPAGSWKCPEAIRLAAAYWPAHELETVDRVVYRESRCNPGAENLSYLEGGRDYSLGLFQINVLGSLWPDRAARCELATREQLYDAPTNVRCAHVLWLRSGWAPWGL